MKIISLRTIFQRFFIPLAIAIGISLFWMNLAMAQEQSLRTLTVTGQGIERIPTTLTQVELGMQIEGNTAEKVYQEVAQNTSRVVDYLRSQKVERLQTESIRLQPNYKYENNQRLLLGYIGSNTISFRLQTEKVGRLLDEAVKAGATQINNISFTATEEAISNAQKEALKQATIDAKQQADAVLEALGFSAKEIVSISVNGANPPQPKPMAMTRAVAQGLIMRSKLIIILILIKF